METAWFRFYEELNDFLPEHRRKQAFPWEFEGRPTVKHLIESIGVPHTEIDLILVNGVSVDFFYHIHDQDTVSVYPVLESMDISPIVRLRPTPLRKTTFVLDVHLGKLARKLRLLGFDTLYRNDYDDSEIVAIAASEHRIVLTRDIQLLKASLITHGYWVRSMRLDEQIVEVLRRFDLFSQIHAFRHCANCNGKIRSTTKAAVLHLLEPKTKQYYDDFFQCEGCGQVYWKGSHYPDIVSDIEQLRRLNDTTTASY